MIHGVRSRVPTTYILRDGKWNYEQEISKANYGNIFLKLKIVKR